MRLVISTHLDDAVFSCHSVLEPGTRVVTAFSGIPHEAATGGYWDRLAGHDDPRRLAQKRREEDAMVLEELGCSWRHLDFPEEQYREDGDLVLSDLRAALLDEVRHADEVWFPAGCATHTDHVVTSALCFSFLQEIIDGTRCFAYADYPYWLITELRLGRGPIDDGLGAWFDETVARRLPGLDDRYELVARRLNTAQAAHKEASMRGYATQFDPVNATVDSQMTAPEHIGREYFWSFTQGVDTFGSASVKPEHASIDEGARR